MEMAKVVSIIIPCYNAERWVAEAIESCLKQTHSPVEIIVVDDGSTDRSLEVIKSFGERIRWESGPNRGGSHARNRGFARSTGEYIQFLDADDYLLPEKIARQVACLETTGADVVYGDWRHQHHRADGRVEMEAVAVSGEKSDVLEALLSGWWVANMGFLFRRHIVEAVQGWDESLAAAQDTDFIISVALAGAKIRYQPGCESIYRRYGNVTVGTSKRPRWLENHGRVLDKAREALIRTSRLTPNYRQVLARSYFQIARGCFEFNRPQFDAVMARVLELEPEFQPQAGTLYNAVQRLIGFKGAEWVAYAKRQLQLWR